jgi:hypothetical protein
MRWTVLCLGIFGYLGAGASTSARDLGQWENGDPAIKQWYQALMQPDVPSASCCGEADAYWAEIEIPDHKLKWDKSNPTGHGIVFLSRTRYVFCYVQPGGV